MNLDFVSALRFADTDQDYEARDSQLYAMSLGMAGDPLDADELPYAYESLPGRPLLVVPTQAVILGWQPFWHDDPRAAIAWKQIVHGEQHLRLHAPLPPAGRVRTQHRLVSVQDKGPGGGALLQIDTELYERESGRHLASLSSLQFLRGDGGCGDWGRPTTPALATIADDARCIARVDLRTTAQSALLYRAVSRDWMPIHADPGVAREAGFERPISHGLNNLGLACRAILKNLLPGRPEAVRSIATRFVAPGLPGDTVRVEVFDAGAGHLQFRATAVERETRLLDRGHCTLDPS